MIIVANSKMAQTIDEWVPSERDRRILKRKHIDGKGYEFIAEEEGVSQKTVQNVMNKWMPIVRANL